MPVELDHLGCDITELGKHFLPKYLHYVSGGKKKCEWDCNVTFPYTETRRKRNLKKRLSSQAIFCLLRLEDLPLPLKYTFSFYLKTTWL